MSRFVLVVASVLALSELSPAGAQYFGAPFPVAGYAHSHYRSGFGFSVGGPNLRISGFAGGYATRSVAYGPAFAPVYGPGFAPVFGPPVVVVAVPVQVQVPVPVVIGGNANPRNDDVLFPRGARPDDFLVIAPRGGGAVRQPEPQPRPLFDPDRDVRVEAAEADPKKEAERRVRLGRAAFAEAAYGRAAEHFEKATASDPTDAGIYFLHAQAKFASGEYADAVAQIRDGLARDRRWPESAFNPAAMYGDARQFAKHLTDLRKAAADNPTVTLEFLLGYQLWFGGEKAEADRVFRAAERRLMDPGPFALFKLP